MKRWHTSCWLTPSSMASLPQPPTPSSGGIWTTHPSETHTVSSPQTRHQSKVSAEGDIMDTLGLYWQQHNMRSSVKTYFSAQPTPVERPLSQHGQPPLTRICSSAIKKNSIYNTTSVVTSTLPSATGSSWTSRTRTSPPSRTRSQATPDPPHRPSWAIYMATTPGYWPRTLQPTTRSLVIPSIPTSSSRASTQG